MFSRSSKPHNPPPSNDPFDSPFDSSFDSSSSGPSSDPFGSSGPHAFGDFSGSSFASSEDDCFGSSPSPASGSGGSSGGSGPSGNGRRPIWIFVLLAVVLLTVIVLAARMGSPSVPTFVPQLDAGAISAEIEPLENGQYRLKLRHELEGLDPSQVYVAGYLMAPEGESLIAINEPDHILKSERFTASAEIIITRPGNYQVAFYSYSLVNPIPVITQAQLIRLDAATAQTPLPEETTIIVVTPSPSPTPTSTPTPTPRPTSTPQRTASIPTPSPTPALQLKPASDLFTLYDVNTRYYYHLLTDVQKQAFSQMYDGIAAGKSKIPLTPCAKADYLRASQALEYDCPELFHWDHEKGSTYYSNSQNLVVALEPNQYAYDVTTYRTKLNQVLSAIRALSSLPGFQGNDFSKQKTIYDELIRRATYDKELPYCAYADSIYLYGYAKCTGYARALNLALRFYGIPCAEVVGDTYDNGVLAPTSHMWSVARIDGAWYHCDATWDDIDTPFIRHAYLNLTDRLMFSSRVQDEVHDTLPLPSCTSTAANAMMVGGTYVRAGSNVRSILIREMANAILSGGGYIQFSYESSADCSTTLMLLQDQDIMNEIYAKANKTQFRCTYYTCADVNYIGVNIYFK